MTSYTGTLYYDWLYSHTKLRLAIQAHCIMTGYTGTLHYDWLYWHTVL